MTVWIAWLPEHDAEVRTAYVALGIGETIQAQPEALADGSYLVGSSVLTMEQALTLPHVTASSMRLPEWVRADDDD